MSDYRNTDMKNISNTGIAAKSRKHRKSWKMVLAAVTALMLIFTSCAGEAATSDASNSQTVTTSAVTTEAAGKTEMFTDRDLSGEYDEKDAVSIDLSGSSASVSSSAAGVDVSGSTVTITEEGTYIVSGTLADGQIIVDADDSAKVQIVLKDASITSSTSAALYVKSADKVFVTTASGTENTLANGGNFTAIDDSNIDGAVFAKDDITFNGSGSLTVTSPAGHGIVGKDDVKLAGGTIEITAAKHGIQANDSVRVAEADITITAEGKDGIHVSDSSDEESGETSDSYFYMADGSLTIAAGDDGIHADAEALVEGGSIDVTKSYEGIEALSINVSGGDIKVKASDDGLNAAGGSSQGSNTFGDDDWMGGHGGGFNDGGTDGTIEISGGELYIQAGGDGVDSNGSVLISGGYTVVCGPTQGDTSVLDYNTTGTITGGTFVGTGGAGMAENFSSAENQGVIAVTTGNQSAGETVTLTDQDGNAVAEVTPELDYAVVYVSTPSVTQGNTYNLSAGSYSESIELTDSIYSTISGGMGGRGGFGGGQGDFGDQDGMNGQGDFGDQDGMNGQRDFGDQDGMNGQRGFGDRGSQDGFGGQEDFGSEDGDSPIWGIGNDDRDGQDNFGGRGESDQNGMNGRGEFGDRDSQNNFGDQNGMNGRGGFGGRGGHGHGRMGDRNERGWDDDSQDAMTGASRLPDTGSEA